MIGVFDSGHGGLTVLQALTRRLPEEAFTYLGDHGNAPYGPRPEAEIYALTLAAVERLFAEGCRLVLVACNTASAVALRRLQQEWLPSRSEEHTSELQTLMRISYAVFCLKKKTNNITY